MNKPSCVLPVVKKWLGYHVFHCNQKWATDEWADPWNRHGKWFMRESGKWFMKERGGMVKNKRKNISELRWTEYSSGLII